MTLTDWNKYTKIIVCRLQEGDLAIRATNLHRYPAEIMGIGEPDTMPAPWFLQPAGFNKQDNVFCWALWEVIQLS